MKESQVSPVFYQEIIEVVEKHQGNKSAIIILQNSDNTTTYLRYGISKKDMIEMLRNAYSD